MEADHERSRRTREDLDGEANVATAGYGEFDVGTLCGLVKMIQTEGWGLGEREGEGREDEQEEGSSVWDLGSGSGRGLFAACLAHGFTAAVGVEYLPPLHESALVNLDLWNSSDRAAETGTVFDFRLR